MTLTGLRLSHAALATAVSLPVSACGPPGDAVTPDAGVLDTVVVVEPDPIHRYLTAPLPELVSSFEAAVRLVGRSDSARQAREWDRAAAALDSAVTLLPTLEDWRPLLLAEVFAEAGDTARTHRLLSELDPRTGLAERWGWSLLSRARMEAGDREGARRAAEQRAESTAGEESARAWLRVGRLALTGGDTARARAAFLRAVDEGVDPEARPSRPAVQASLALAPLGGLTEDERYRLGRLLVDSGEWESGYELLRETMGRVNAAEEERHAVRLEMARALFALGRYGDAETELRILMGRELSREMSARVLLLLARTEAERGREGDARRTLLRLVGLHPDQPAAGDAFLLLADRAEAAGREEEAHAYYRQAVEAGLKTSEVDRAALEFGTRAYLDGRYETAAQVFDLHRAGHVDPSGRQQATYWAGLAHRRLGNREQARDRFLAAFAEDPFSYYGQLAAEEADAAVLPPDLPPGPVTPEELERELANALLRLRFHLEVPTSGSFLFEHERLKRYFSRYEGGVYALAEAMVEDGWPMRGILLGREILQEEDEWNLRLLRIIYPFPHRELIAAEAEARGVNPFFAAAMIRQESMFEAEIVSMAGAVGLMQVLPSTARATARSLGLGPVDAEALKDPEVNVPVGMAYLAQMIRRFDAQVPDILAAYNAGPSRIRRWRGMPAYADRNVFVERIPFRETRSHVKVVELNTRLYTALYGCGDFEPCFGMSYPTYLAEHGVGAATVPRVAR